MQARFKGQYDDKDPLPSFVRKVEASSAESEIRQIIPSAKGNLTKRCLPERYSTERILFTSFLIPAGSKMSRGYLQYPLIFS